MRFQVYLFIFGLIDQYLDPVLCDTYSDNEDLLHEKMEMMEGDIMGIAPSLLQSAPGIRNKASWPENIITYRFEHGYPLDLRLNFKRAAQYISQYTCIKFIPRTRQRDYVQVIQDGDNCYSWIGRMGNGPQKMSLSRKCNDFGTFVHEMLHALGYIHEQNRFDRDNYVTINWNNISPEPYIRNQFQVDPNRLTSEYDYNSVMHYDRKAFSRNEQDTIVPKKQGVHIGQLKGMSRGDVDEINRDFCS